MTFTILSRGVVMAALLLSIGVGYAAGSEREREQRPADTRHDRQSRDMPSKERRDFTTESHVPPRSPDLGIPTNPLSPSTAGPGSGLFGVEAGRIPTPAAPPISGEGSRERQRR